MWADRVNPQLIKVVRDHYPLLYEHQILGTLFLRLTGKAILADQQGLGKTAQAICASAKPILVICPASVQLNWKREIGRWNGSKSINILSSKSKDLNFDWLIINYAMLEKFQDLLLKKKFQTVILDESHYIKNHKTKRSRVVLGGLFQQGEKRIRKPGIISGVPYRYLLSGTPMNNRPIELFSQLKAIEHPLSRDWIGYVRRFCNAQRKPWGWDVSGASNISELAQELEESYLRRRKDQVVDLPEILPTFVDIETSPKEVRKEQGLLGEAQTEGQLLAAIGKIKQANALLKLPYCIEVLDEIVEDPQNKVVVFSFYIEIVKALAEHFGDRAVKLLGETALNQRQKAIDRFNSDENCQVFVANIVAGGIGINLMAANYVVINDLTWDPTQIEQAHDRVHRIGQERTVNVYFLNIVNSEIEKHMVGLLAKKNAIIKSLNLPIETSAIELHTYVRQRLVKNRSR